MKKMMFPAIALALSLVASGPAWAEGRMILPSVDSHLRYLDFTQRSDGFPALAA